MPCLPRIPSIKVDAFWLSLFAVIMNVWYHQIKSQYDASARLVFTRNNITSIGSQDQLKNLYSVYNTGLNCDNNRKLPNKLNDLKAFCNRDVNLNTFGDSLGLEKSTTGVCRDKHGSSKFGRPSHQNYNPCKCFVHYLDPQEISQCDIDGMISWNEEFLWQPFIPILIALVFNWVIAIVEFKPPSLLDEVKKIPVFSPVL